MFEFRCELRLCEPELRDHSRGVCASTSSSAAGIQRLASLRTGSAAPQANDFSNESLSAQHVFSLDQAQRTAARQFPISLWDVRNAPCNAVRGQRNSRNPEIREHVPLRDVSSFAARFQLFASILAERLEQSIARFFSFEVRHNQRLADERGDQRQYVVRCNAFSLANGGRRRDRTAPGEYREAFEHRCSGAARSS